MRNFFSVGDTKNIDGLIQKALAYKKSPLSDRQLGAGKRLGLLFLNPSMRTRLSTQIAAINLGMEPIVFNVGQEGWTLEFGEDTVMDGKTVEHVKDAAPVLGKYFDILGIRTFPSLTNKDEDYNELFLKQFIEHSGIPVVSLESATLHPLQSLTDLLTIHENFNEKRKPKVVLTWAPHVKAIPQCVANSFSQWITAWGQAEFVIVHPAGYELDASFTRGATILHDQDTALKNADFVYVKNWSEFTNYGQVSCMDKGWMISKDKLVHTRNAKIMHCLPVRRNVELAGEVLDGPNSLVTQQAANRVWAAQAVLSEILKENR